MKWYTHAAVGANAVWLVTLRGVVDQTAILLMIVGALASLLPDVDAAGKGAKIHYIAYGVFGMLKNTFRHRSFFHSLLAIGIVFILSYIFLSRSHSLLPWIIALGYASHPLIDGLNLSGVRYVYPLKTYFHLAPSWLRSPVGGIADSLLFALGVSGIIFFIFSHYSTWTNFATVFAI